jgi:hypothetical protein
MIKVMVTRATGCPVKRQSDLYGRGLSGQPQSSGRFARLIMNTIISILKHCIKGILRRILCNVALGKNEK